MGGKNDANQEPKGGLMRDLFSLSDPLQAGYERIYESLCELREGFHRSGRLDDSNAKLDEVLKLFATYLAFRAGQIGAFPSVKSRNLIRELQDAFSATAALPQYQEEGRDSTFGAKPALVIRPGDESLAKDLIRLVRDCIDLAFDLRLSDTLSAITSAVTSKTLNT
jgi:hypothetical protein